jgi:nucleoside-diphosphate-sugar epimerase
MSMRKILITGAAGFVGCHLARRLLEDETNELVLVDNLVRGQSDEEFSSLLENPRVKFKKLNLTASEAYDELGGDFDEVYHLAAIIGVANVMAKPHDVLRINALTMISLLEWGMRGGGARKILFSSTSEAYAWTQLALPLPVPTPEDVPLALTDLANPRSSYAGSKIFGELAMHQYSRIFGTPFVTVRFHNVYGPRMGFDHVIPQLFQRARKAEGTLEVYSADHRRAFCHVNDAVEMCIRAMRHPEAKAATLNVGNDREEVTIADLAEKVVAWCGKKLTLVPVPATHDPIRRRCPDISRAKALLDYTPRIDLREGLDATLRWYERALASRS